MLGSLAFRDHWFLVAVGLHARGERQLVGIRAGSPENEEAAQLLVADLIARADAARPPSLFFAGESPALRAALQHHFGRSILVQRCPAEKRRRVLGLLPPTLQPSTREELTAAHLADDAAAALRAIQRLAKSIEADHPRAAEVLREGIEQTLTLQRLALLRDARPATPSLPAVTAPQRGDFLL
jgi:transposase-like protein